MEYAKESNRNKCTCERCGTVLDYSFNDPNLSPVVNTIDRYSYICPVCGNTIHGKLSVGELEKK